MNQEPGEPPANSDLIGRRFGVYEVRELLGAGGMGEVYRAHDVGLHRDVAIKVIPASFTSDPLCIARFEREAQILASLNHPHIATVYGFEHHSGLRALILELVEGETLAARLERGALPLAEALQIARQLSDAVGAAHAAGVIHRDIKPANILISRDGRAKIIDFGVATLLASDVADTVLELTTPGAVVGTARYMSPEQSAGLPADARSDVFSLGLVIGEAVTGDRSFRASDRLPEISSPALRAVLVKALARDSGERYPTARELSAALQHLQAGGEAPRRPLAAATAVVASAAVALAVWAAGFPAWWPRERPAAQPGEAIVRVAVLPFENLSRNAADNWLAAAFSDSLTLGLRSLGNIVVVDRDRVIEFLEAADIAEGAAIDVRATDVPGRLGVQEYVHGTFQRVGANVRVAARLVDAARGVVRVQAAVTGPVDDLFQLEDELARRFATAIDAGATLGAPVSRGALDAYQLAIDGKRLYAVGQYADSADRFQAAVRIDPEYAEAWALLAKATARLAAPASTTTSGVGEYRERALRAAERAVTLAPSQYESHVALALASREAERLDEWRIAARRAIAINPRIAEAHALLADSYSAIPTWGCGRDRDPAEAERHYRDALQLDPRWYAAYTSLITELQWTGRLEDALRVSDEALQALPGNRAIRTYRGLLLTLLDRQDEGELDLMAAIPENSPSLLDQLFLGGIDLRRGHEDTAARRFNFILQARTSPVTLLLVAYAYVMSGYADGAAPFIASAIKLDPDCASFVSRSPIKNEGLVRLRRR